VTAESVSLYEAAGGMPFFEALVDRFYDGVAGDPELLPLYPEPQDLAPARHRLTLFLAQYWGGPTTYDAERGHPRLRMRHQPFAIGSAERDRWLVHMRAAVEACARLRTWPDGWTRTSRWPPTRCATATEPHAHRRTPAPSGRRRSPRMSTDDDAGCDPSSSPGVPFRPAESGLGERSLPPSGTGGHGPEDL
jgi:hemoglobin